VAATITLIVGAILFSIYFPNIDNLSRGRRSLSTETAAFVAGEHTKCVGDGRYRAGKASWTVFAEAQRNLTNYLEVPLIPIADLAPLGYEFVGAGQCGVPGVDRSGHMIYRRGEGRETVYASVFVVPHGGQYRSFGRSQPGVWYALTGADGAVPVSRMFVGKVVYLLVSGDPDDTKSIEDAITAAVLEVW